MKSQAAGCRLLGLQLYLKWQAFLLLRCRGCVFPGAIGEVIGNIDGNIVEHDGGDDLMGACGGSEHTGIAANSAPASAPASKARGI